MAKAKTKTKTQTRTKTKTKPTAGKSTPERKRVKFECRADKGKRIYVAGSFNAWNPKKNQLKYKDGLYSTSILLKKGKYEYKFVIDGAWCIDPECPDWTPNDMGSLNSVMSVR
jgi:1,4-alpha-glucan branching enzyme